MAHAEIVGAGEAKVVAALDKNDRWELIPNDVNILRRRCVVHYDDLERNGLGVAIHTYQAATQVVRRVPGRDDDGELHKSDR